MNYKVGDEIICIDSIHGKDSIKLLERGKAYIAAKINPACCGNQMVVDVGITSDPRIITRCNACRAIIVGAWFEPWRFIKLDKLVLTEEESQDASLPEHV